MTMYQPFDKEQKSYTFNLALSMLKLLFNSILYLGQITLWSEEVLLLIARACIF
jgi:hypothetical protein